MSLNSRCNGESPGLVARSLITRAVAPSVLSWRERRRCSACTTSWYSVGWCMHASRSRSSQHAAEYVAAGRPSAAAVAAATSAASVVIIAAQLTTAARSSSSSSSSSALTFSSSASTFSFSAASLQGSSAMPATSSSSGEGSLVDEHCVGDSSHTSHEGCACNFTAIPAAASPSSSSFSSSTSSSSIGAAGAAAASAFLVAGGGRFLAERLAPAASTLPRLRDALDSAGAN